MACKRARRSGGPSTVETLIGEAKDGDVFSRDTTAAVTAVVPVTRACRRDSPCSEVAVLVGFVGVDVLGDERQ
eukprot:scaffold98_cov172-Amphora_coffeaeformis.AAC.31